MATAELERLEQTESAARARERAGEEQTRRHIDDAAHRLQQDGIVRLAVVGPEDGADAILARQLGVEEIDVHQSISGMMVAIYERGVAGLLTRGVKPEARNRSLSDLWHKAGHASIAHILHAGTGTSTDVLVAHRSPQNEGMAFALEMLRENTGRVEIQDGSLPTSLARDGLHVVAQAMRLAYPGQGMPVSEPLSARPQPTYFVPTNF